MKNIILALSVVFIITANALANDVQNPSWSISKLEVEMTNGRVIQLTRMDNGLTGTAVTIEGQIINFTVPGTSDIPENIAVLAQQKDVLIDEGKTAYKLYKYAYLLLPFVQFVLIIMVFIIVIKVYKKVSQ